MTVDKSLRVRKGVGRSRNVLKRAERIEKLQEQERWGEDANPFSLPKVRVYKVVIKKKKKKKGEEEGATPAAAGAKTAKAAKTAKK